ncbi:hypothetical protein [Nonomuraea sp. NPDC023979]|uniref:hypothetical protein n=1 Tax=Nonomuraea sp. NPDC023979 TaxID=3154796 RepID=UPI0033E1FCED
MLTGRRVAYLELLSCPEYGTIDVGSESGERSEPHGEDFVTAQDNIFTIQCAQDGVADVALIVEEWTGAPASDPPGWRTWELESQHELEIEEYLVIAAPGTQGDDLRGLRLRAGYGVYHCRIRAQGRTEVRRRIAELARRDELLERANDLDGIERYLIQFWPSQKNHNSIETEGNLPITLHI